MAFRSRAQIEKFRALERQGKLPEGTASRWLAETPHPEKLVKRVGPAPVRRERRSNRAPAFPSVTREARRRGR